MRRAAFALAAIATVTSPAAAAADPVVLKPSSPWNVDFAETKCRLARLFGEGDDRHLLGAVPMRASSARTAWLSAARLRGTRDIPSLSARQELPWSSTY